ncbi:MAG: tetratricopeptide repeat protein [bacterium]
MKIRAVLTALIVVLLGTCLSAETMTARQAFTEGQKLLAEEQYYPAIEKFKLAILDHSYPLLDYCYFYVAVAYEKKQNYEHAEQVYDTVIKYFDNSVLLPPALLAKAKISLAQNDIEAAEKVLYQLIAQFPGHNSIPEARFLLGDILEKQKRYADAARVFRNLDLLHGKSEYAEKAIDRLDELAKKKLVAGYEAPAATIYNLGVKYFQDSNYVKAKGYFTRLTKFYKKSSFHDEAVMMLGRIHLRKGRLGDAVQAFKKTINLDQDSKPEAMYYLARTYLYQKNPQAAVNTLEKLVSLFPKNSWAGEALLYLGDYYKKEGEIDKALGFYEQLLTLNLEPDLYQRSVWATGNLYYKKGDYKKAYETFGLAIGSQPEKARDEILFWAAKSAARSGDREQAIAAYKSAVAFHDHTYYGYRAREELKKYGLEIKTAAVPEVKDLIAGINGLSAETISHEKKYRELLAVGLDEEAAEEASFIEDKVPVTEKDRVQLAKYHSFIMKGKFAKPIFFADQKLNQAEEAGTLDQIDPRMWRFAYPRGYWQYVEKYAKEYGLDPYLVYAVIREESRFKERALSHASAHGLMQIIPSTGRLIANALGMRYSRWNMYQPRVNIQMGCYYLAQTIKRFDGNVSLALAGYNGGPNRVSKWLKNYPQFDLDEFVEDIPLTETRNYVKKVMKSYYGYKRVYSGG